MMPGQKLPRPRPFLPKAKPLPTRKRMTIGVGILADDGIVFATDSQATTDIKSHHGKIAAVASQHFEQRPDGTVLLSHPGGCVVAVAGFPGEYSLRAAELITGAFNNDKTLTGGDLRLAFEAELGAFHMEHVVPYLGLPQLERPDVQLLVGVYRDGRMNLWHSHKAVLLSASPYWVIGSGHTQAYPLLGHLYKPNLSLVDAIIMAAFVVHQTKEVNTHCGKATRIYCLRNNAFSWVNGATCDELDRAFSLHQTGLVASGFWQARSIMSQDDKDHAVLIRERLAKIAKLIQTTTLFEAIGDGPIEIS
jgi:hypothetical protein